jgi:hypothetical protein
MDKTTLHKIFNKAFDDASWLEVLKSVFGAKLGLLAQPKPIQLPNEDKASAAFELGSFTTTDDRIIGLYKIEVKPEVWLERNKVGLRQLLRKVYDYDVDGAIIVFVQQEKWRLSFVSEIKVLNDEGEIIEQATEPKRYTYLLGEDEKVRTPSDRLSKLSGKSLALQDILNAFSVEALNEEFYKIIQAFFYELVGGKVGKGKKVNDYGNGILQLPSVPKENRQVYQEFAVRLIGRTVFCWFLKMKKSDQQEPLLPENLLSLKAAKSNANYYHSILERLFFQTLNTPMEQRVDNLPEGAEQIPFLNGGLFEPGNQDYYKPNKFSGLNENLNTLKIDDQWFVQFFEELEKYNFTIDENSVTDVEVSVDPEMLGRIFENLLAEIDPDSGETARKATGSFYTPREIVDYMATESLVQYIHNKTNLPQDQLRPIFKMMEKNDPEFSASQKESILDALDKVKILDPACGSGAFPMGVLQKIVQALQKLDPEAEWWKKRQVSRVSNAIVRKQLKEKLESSGVEYARKIGVIQNSLYGVDIQLVAAEISKLRCFLSLVVDENIDENKPNRGIEPLPNLEFKFVTADTLIKLPEENGQRGLFDNWEEVQELEELRNDYIQSYGKQKQRIKEQFLTVQQKMFKDQLSLFSDKTSRAFQLSTWNPFGHEKSDWFDPKWMFGVEKFDVVIGNPPYVDSEKMTILDKDYRETLKNEYSFASGNWDLFLVFIERGIQLLNNEGSFSYIIPNKLIGAKYAVQARLGLAELKLVEIADYSRINVFKTADVYPITIVLTNTPLTQKDTTSFVKINEDYQIQSKINIELFKRINDPFWDKYFLDKKSFKLIETISKKKKISDFNKFSITSSATVSEAYSVKEYIFDDEDDKNSFKIINTGTIDPYVSLWGFKSMQYIKEKYDYPRIGYNHLKEINKTRFEQSSSPKIIIAGMSLSFEAFLDIKGEFSAAKSTSIVLGNLNDLVLLLAVLNSSTIRFYVQNQYLSLKMAGGYLNINPDILKNTPLPTFSNYDIISFQKITSFIINLLNLKSDITINTHVPNSHIAQLFEEVIDAMVMELYFKEDFEKAGIAFIKYAERDFESIEGKTEQEQIEIIHRAYQMLQEKDNEIRNNLKLMDIKLADIVMPIKAAK